MTTHPAAAGEIRVQVEAIRQSLGVPAGQMFFPNMGDESFTPDHDDVWGRCTILWGQGVARENIGGDTSDEYPGVCQVDLFHPARTGDGAALAAADAFIAHFKSLGTVSGVTFGVPSITAQRDEGPHYVSTLRVPFTFDSHP